ncbi:MAG: hypothetical protein HY226_00020 [Candidatus Vogelbacteria bacterium]|nr:hypothetical protein [Candidatus Vogelbacteria bacterium]
MELFKFLVANTYGGVMGHGFFLPALIILLIVWSLIWKGMALWRAARLGHKEWFVFHRVRLTFYFYFGLRYNTCSKFN